MQYSIFSLRVPIITNLLEAFKCLVSPVSRKVTSLQLGLSRTDQRQHRSGPGAAQVCVPTGDRRDDTRTLACPSLASRAELGLAHGVKPKGAQHVSGEPALAITLKKQ